MLLSLSEGPGRLPGIICCMCGDRPLGVGRNRLAGSQPLPVVVVGREKCVSIRWLCSNCASGAGGVGWGGVGDECEQVVVVQVVVVIVTVIVFRYCSWRGCLGGCNGCGQV